MKTPAMLLIAALLVVTGCGGDDETPSPARQQSPDAAEPKEDTEDGAMAGEDDGTMAADVDRSMPKAKGTTVTIGDSQFGRMLFNSKRQAIYIFEKDPKGDSVCYDECAEAWPPVFTEGEPVAGGGVEASLLGTVKRSDGKLQVTYADQPLYYYAHEDRGEVRCHNVELNGGLWWVIGPDGKRRP
jgi:predicted lipoprotein with Yx(FWY)xxD motif